MSAMTPKDTSADAIWNKVKPHKFIALFATALGVFFLIGLIVILLVRPGEQQPRCPPAKKCGTPPTLPTEAAPLAAKPLVSGRVWRSSALHYKFEYDPSKWKVVKQNSRGAILDWS